MAMRKCGSSLLQMPYYSTRSIFVQSSKKMTTDSTATAGKQKTTDSTTVPSWCSEILMCPLSRKPLRRSIGASNGGEGSEDSLLSDAYPCIAYPIRDGIPCLIPSLGKLLKSNDDGKASETPKTDVCLTC